MKRIFKYPLKNNVIFNLVRLKKNGEDVWINKIQVSENELKELSTLNYVDLGVEIISKFCTPALDKDQIELLLDKAYSSFDTKNIVEIKKIKLDFMTVMLV